MSGTILEEDKMKLNEERKFVLSRTKDTHSEVFYTLKEVQERVSEILKKERYDVHYVRAITLDEDTLKLDYGAYNDFFYIKTIYDEV